LIKTPPTTPVLRCLHNRNLVNIIIQALLLKNIERIFFWRLSIGERAAVVIYVTVFKLGPIATHPQQQWIGNLCFERQQQSNNSLFSKFRTEFSNIKAVVELHTSSNLLPVRVVGGTGRDGRIRSSGRSAVVGQDWILELTGNTKHLLPESTTILNPTDNQSDIKNHEARHQNFQPPQREQFQSQGRNGP
jgi:hypothetical protein